MIRIANGQGFWGDWLEAPVRLVEQRPIDYLILDYLASHHVDSAKAKGQRPQPGLRTRLPPLNRPYCEADTRAQREGDRQRAASIVGLRAGGAESRAETCVLSF